MEGASDPGGAVIVKDVCTNYGDLCLGGSYVMESLKWKSINKYENQHQAERKQKK
jgi:hypothetical protein